MLKKLFRKKTSPVSQEQDADTATDLPGSNATSAEDAYAEQPVEGARVTASPQAGGSPAGQAGRGPTVADEASPQALIAQAVGSHAVTLAKTNSILKLSTLSLAGLSLVLGLAAYSGWSKEPEYRYFFVSTDGRVLERTPLSEPVLSLNNVRDFYAESMSHLFSFHYRNFADHYQRLAPDIMTERAMLEFANELERIGLIKSMTDRREVAEAVILQTPVLNGSGEDPSTGLYTWELSLPFNLRLESGLRDGGVRRMGGVARVQVVRVEPHVHPRQILINRVTIRDTVTND